MKNISKIWLKVWCEGDEKSPGKFQQNPAKNPVKLK